ncbi:hypothetical protein IV203_002996 [Nitzschia inconspicua]|uniref:Uncharacterized protein n=1 Tax=Nitzschia inconspicua TaxID=303405 RepID=A0A9K3L2S4_9STRA|nr:hypothetical protein IV203_002996 [Nitzschia inconspicua]
METANKANPLHFIPKPPSSTESENPSQPRKSFWNIGQSRRHQLVTDESEDAVLCSVEERGANTKTGEDGFRPAVKGETPPLNVPTLGNAFQPPPSLKRDSTSGSKSYTEKALVLQRQKSHAIRSLEHGRHRRAKTLLTSLEGSISRRGGDYFGIAAEDDHFREFDKIYDDNIASNTVSGEDDDEEDDDGKSTGDTETGTEEYNDEELAGERLPLLRRTSSSNKKLSDRQLKARKVLKKRQLKKIREFLNPLRMLKDLGRGIMHSTLFVSLIFFTIAWILYYYCGNPPPPDFLPGTARLSWWCNFAGRQLLMFELARVWQFLFMDCFVLAFRFVPHFFGPWFTIYCIQSKGWPFVVFSWGLFDLLLLHGDNQFHQHWFYWTGIQIYQSANSGSWILDSENYLRILLCMLVAGILAALKRTIVSLYFGRRMVDMYRQRLDEILNEIIMISEIAELSVESESIVNVLGVKSQDDNDEESLNKEVETQSLIKPRISAVRCSEVKFNHDEDMSRIGLGNDLTERDIEKIELEGQTYSEAPRWNSDDEEAKGGKTGFYDSSSGFPTMDLLDKWDDPVKKRDKSYDASVNDILKFRKALTYMNLDFPFSEAFGRASTRKEMVRSSELVYSRLQKLAPGKDFLPCSVFQILYWNEDDVDTDSESVTFHLAVRSRYTWQVSNRVLQCQGELHQFCVSLAYKHHIHFDSPNPRSVTYYGGSLVDGGIKKYKANILERKNIRNDSKIIAGVLPADMARQLSGESSGVSSSEMIHPSPLAALATRNLAQRKSQGSSELKEKEAAECSEKVAGRIGDASALNESATPAANAPAVGRSSDNDRFLSMLQDFHP